MNNDEILTINLTKLYEASGMLVSGEQLEIGIIEQYSFNASKDHNIMRDFTNDLLNKMYGKDGHYPYHKINTFFNGRKYINIVTKYIAYIDHMVLNKTSPIFEDIIFHRIIREKDGKFVVEFKVQHD